MDKEKIIADLIVNDESKKPKAVKYFMEKYGIDFWLVMSIYDEALERRKRTVS